MNALLFKFKSALYLLLSAFMCVGFDLSAQEFANGDLEGPEIMDITKLVAWDWKPLAFPDPLSKASHLGGTTADLSSETAKIAVMGKPQSGKTFLSALFSKTKLGFYHEGIRQTVNCFKIGKTYSVEFYQTVVKQLNCLDKTGSWAVYGNDVLLGISSTSTSNLVHTDMDRLWEKRTITFVAAATSIEFKFIPHDDDGNPGDDLTLDEGLRMGIDNIKLTYTTEDVLPADITVCPLPYTIIPLLGATYTYKWDNGTTSPTHTANTARTYKVTATDAAGCSIKDSIVISTCAVNTNCTFQLENSDFEEPNIVAKYGGRNVVIPETDLPGWKTTAADNMVEVWDNGFMGHFAYSGKQFMELNANVPSSLYSDANTIPGSTITFGFAHKGRQGTDVLELKIGPPGGPYISQGKYSTSKAAWKYYTVTYKVPAGQTTTRFMFSAVSSVGGLSLGNFLDAINVIDVDIDMDLKAYSTCGSTKGKIEVNADFPAGIKVEYSIDNVNFQTDPFFNDLPLGEYTVYLKADGICIRQKKVTIPPSTALIVDLGNDTSLCTGNIVLIDSKIKDATYAWNTGANTQSITVNSSGIYSIEVTDTNGCKASDEINVRVNSNPLVALGNDKQICEGSLATLDAVVLGVSYAWSSGENTQSISVNSSGTYSVEVTDGNGCKGSDEIKVTVNVNPVIALGKDKQICEGSLATLDAVIAGATYAWNTGANTQSITINSSGTYSVEVIDANGCKGSDEIIVTVNANPVVALGNDIQMCAGTSVTLDAAIVGVTYLWSTGENSQSISVNSSATYSVEVSDANGCKASDEIDVSVNSTPIVALGSDIQICTGTSATIDAKIVGATYAWNTGANTQSIIVNSAGIYSVEITDANGCKGSDEINVTVNANLLVALGSDKQICDGTSATLDAAIVGAIYTWNTLANTQSITVNSSGTYSVEVIDANGCKGSDEIVVTVNANPVVALGNDIQMCAGASVTLDAAVTGVTYLWSTGENSQSISVKSSDTYSVEVSDVNGCKASDEIKVTIAPPIVIDLGNDTTICEGESLELNVNNSDKIIVWNTGENTSSIVVNNSGNYSVEVIDALGCKASDNINIDLENIINPFSYTDTTLCEGETILLKANANPYLVRWTNSGDKSEILVSSSGVYNATVSSKHCKENYTINVIVIDTPKISIVNKYGKEYYCFENEKAVVQLAGENLVKYNIQWKGIVNNADKLEVNKSGEYAAIISNGKCSTEVKIFVKEYCSPTFFIPNAFTPNGDGNNDFFPPQHSGVFEDYQINIFNRWGELIFTSNDISAGWDGKVNGRDVQIDVYVYRISYSINNDSGAKKMEERIGIVNVVR